MDDVLSMRVVEGVRDGGGDVDRFFDAELRLAIQLVAQRLAVDERHDVVKERIGFARIEEREDVWVLEIGGRLYFLDEPLGTQDRC